MIRSPRAWSNAGTLLRDVQFGQWRTIRARPVGLLDADRAAMLPLSPVPPAVGWVNRVRSDSTNTSASTATTPPPHAGDPHVDAAEIGRFVDVTADLAQVSRSARKDVSSLSPHTIGFGHAV